MTYKKQYRWQWIGIMTHYRVNIAQKVRHKARRYTYTQEEIVITESERWYSDYRQCVTAAKRINVNDIGIPDSWGLELRIISRYKIIASTLKKVKNTSLADNRERARTSSRNTQSIKR